MITAHQGRGQLMRMRVSQVAAYLRQVGAMQSAGVDVNAAVSLLRISRANTGGPDAGHRTPGAAGNDRFRSRRSGR